MPKAMPATTHASAVAAEHRCVEVDLPDARQHSRRGHRQEYSHAGGRDKEPQKPAAEREHQTFREQLSHEPRPFRANRRTNADLVLPRRRAH